MENIRQEKLFIFDMDNCLYKDVDNKLEQECFFQCFYDFVRAEYGYDEAEIIEMDNQAMQDYGHYLKGWLETHPEFPIDKLFEFFKGRYSLESVLFSNTLPAWISRLPGKKVVYTNAHRWHAEQALRHMGILEHFDEVYSVNELELKNNHYKPHPAGFERIMDAFGVTAEETVMFEDSKTNLKAADSIGISTVLVNREKFDGEHHVHHSFETIDHFFEAFYRE